MTGEDRAARAGARVKVTYDPPDDRVPVADVKARAGGAFRIEGVPEGRFRVSASAKGHSDASLTLHVRGGERVTALLRLGAGESVSGAVRDRSGRPLPFARLLVWPLEPKGAEPTEARADGTGAFRIADLARGAHGLLVEATGLGSLKLERIEVPARDLVLKLDGEGRSVAGAVVTGGPKGGPVGAARVLLSGDGARLPRTAETSGQGGFVFHGLGAGRYAVRASRGELVSATRTVTVAAGKVAGLVRLELRPGRAVMGHVVDAAGAPLADAEVRVESIPPDDLPEIGRSGANGRFTIGPLPPGEYRVSARRPGYVLAESPRAVLGAGPLPPEVTLTLAPGARIHGRIVDEKGAPVPRATVGILQSLLVENELGIVPGPLPMAAAAAALPRRTLSLAGKSRQVLTDAAGRFELPDVLPGATRLEIIHGDSLPLRTAALSPEAGQTLDAGTLKLRSGFPLAGRIVDESDGPLEHARVDATPAEVFEGGAAAGRETIVVASDRFGEFVVRLSEGVYRLEISAPGRNVETVSVRVPSGINQSPLTVRLARADATLEGTVRDAEDRFIGRAEVHVWVAPPELAATPGNVLPARVPGASAAPALMSTTTDGGGRFRLDRLPRRKLVVEVRHADHPTARQVALPGTDTVVRLATPGGISGEVREKGTGAFVARYRLTAEGPDGRTATPSRTVGAGFEMTRLHPGRWVLTVLAPGFFQGVTAIDVPAGTSPTEPSVRDLRVEIEREPR